MPFSKYKLYLHPLYGLLTLLKGSNVTVGQVIVITCPHGEIHQNNSVHEESFLSWKNILSC